MCTNVFDCCKDNSTNPLEQFKEFLNSENCVEYEETNPDIYICGQIYQKNIIIEEIDVVMRIIRKNWCYIQNVILNETMVSSCDLIQIRELINKCLKLIIHCLRNSEGGIQQRYLKSTLLEMKKFQPLVLPISKLEKDIYLKLNSRSCNKDKCPVYQYFHAFQDVHYYLLLLNHISKNTDELKKHIHYLIKELALLSEKGFKENSESAFLCGCNKSFWLIIQVMCENGNLEESFWSIFNKAVECFDSKYILWLLHDIGNLQAFDINGKRISGFSNRIEPNFIMVESALKKVLLSAEYNSILPTLKSLESLICNLWLRHSQIEIFQILWEYFSKRLNVSARSTTSFTLPELNKLIDTILWSPKDCEHDFELFLAMLCVHLNEHPYHWAKMRGRIYSQLGPNKLKDLSTVGIFHVLLLFLTMTKVNFDELSRKFLSFIENLPVEKKKQNQLIWSFYAAFIVRHIRENRSIETIAPPFIRMLEEASIEKKFFLLQNFVRDLSEIIHSSVNLQLQQWLLINTWIHQYMSSCQYTELIVFLNVILQTIDKVDNEHVWCDWEMSFKNYVFPPLKNVAGPRYGHNTPDTVGKIAGRIVLLSPVLLSDAFTFFNGETITPKTSASFMCVILDNYPNSFTFSDSQETIALQSWVKFCLFSRDGYEEFTRNIIKLDIIPEFIKTSIMPSKDPLCTFIDSLNVEQNQQSPETKLCEMMFGEAERWIAQYFTKPDNEGTVLRIYTCIGLAFFKIGRLLYNKHTSNCSYSRLVSSILLPTEVMRGKPLNSYILQSIKRTWHLFFEATIKLRSPSDAFIDRILRDMIVKYIPHFDTVNSPMLKCLDNELTIEVILDKISNAFFKQPVKEAESNVFKALKLLNDFVQNTTSASSIKLVTNKTLYGLFEVFMFHSQRNMALSIIKNITSSPLYNQVKTDFENTIVLIAEKHMAFHTQNYFQLMKTLTNIIPSSIKNVMPRITQHVSIVERMRGVGYDKNLRLNIERLEANLLELS